MLNLEDNRLGDKNILELIKAISENSSLKNLNLSKNYLTNEVCDSLKKMLTKNDHLE